MTYRLIGTSTVPDEPAAMDKTGSGGSGGASNGSTAPGIAPNAIIATTAAGASSSATSPQNGVMPSSGTSAPAVEIVSGTPISPLSPGRGFGAGLEPGDVEVKGARRKKACLIL